MLCRRVSPKVKNQILLKVMLVLCLGPENTAKALDLQGFNSSTRDFSTYSGSETSY